jgi:hypothetical protein
MNLKTQARQKKNQHLSVVDHTLLNSILHLNSSNRVRLTAGHHVRFGEPFRRSAS